MYRTTETCDVNVKADDSVDYGPTPPNTMGKLWMADLQTSEPALIQVRPNKSELMLANFARFNVEILQMIL